MVDVSLFLDDLLISANDSYVGCRSLPRWEPAARESACCISCLSSEDLNLSIPFGLLPSWCSLSIRASR